MSVLIAVGAVNAFYFALLVLLKRNKVTPDYVLAVFLGLVGVAFALIFGAVELGHDELLLFLVFGNLLYAPILYLYVVTMVDPDHRVPRCFFLHLLPLALSTAYLIALLGSLSDAEIVLLLEIHSFAERPVIFNLFYLMDLGVTPVYVVLSWRLLERHRRQIADRYSFLRSVDYQWIRNLLAVILIIWVVIDLPVQGSSFIDGLTERQSLVIGSSLASLLVLYLGYFGFRQATVYPAQAEVVPRTEAEAEGVPEEAVVPTRYQRSGLSDDEIREHRERLLSLIRTEKPFLDSSLTIRELAAAIGLSEHNASEVINVGLGKSFYDFVNEHRVEEFNRRVVLPESANLTLLAVAMQCGFSSKSSFNRVYKQVTGVTPSAFLRSRRPEGPEP